LNLDEALAQFDLVEVNLSRIEKTWAEIEGLIPTGIVFGETGPEGRRYRELVRAYSELAAALPPVSGYAISTIPMGLNEIAQSRLDAIDLGEVSIEVSVEEGIDAPSREIDEYRFRFEHARRELVRGQVGEISTELDHLVAGLVRDVPADGTKVLDSRVDQIESCVRQIERLAGDQIPRDKSWSDLTRHLHFREGQDLHAIARADWPAVKADLLQSLYSELEALPVSIEDLGTLAGSKPAGPVSTDLPWASLSDEGFERIIFNLISDADDYEQARWLTETRAPDRGRDLAAEHVRSDSLSGTTRERVIVQARHWLKRSIGLPAVRTLLDQMALWEPPAVHILVIATSGRFTTDAVSWIDKHNAANLRPTIIMWANSHLETLIVRRPELLATIRPPRE
jgi:hypothetical protein